MTDLTCDDDGLTIEDLFREAMEQQPDGSWSLRVVYVSSCPVPDLSYLFVDNGNGTYNLNVSMTETPGFTPGAIYVSY
jgi:hypothetical protein